MDSPNEPVNRGERRAVAESSFGVVLLASLVGTYAWVLGKVYAFMTTPLPVTLNVSDLL